MNNIETINMEYRNKKVAFIKHVQETRQTEGDKTAIKILNQELKAIKNIKTIANVAQYNDWLSTLLKTKTRIQQDNKKEKQNYELALQKLFDKNTHLKNELRNIKK